jgi:hypothetical protein
MKYLERGFSLNKILCSLYASKNPGVWGRAPRAIFSTTSGIGWLTEKNSKKMVAFCRILIWSIYGEIKWNTTGACTLRLREAQSGQVPCSGAPGATGQGA